MSHCVQAEPDDARDRPSRKRFASGGLTRSPSSLALILSTVAGYLPVDESERAMSLLDEAIDVGNRCGDAMAVYASIMHKGVPGATRCLASALAASADATEPELEMGDVIGLQSTYMLAAAAFSALGHDEEAAVVIGKVASIESLPLGAFFAVELFAVAQERTHDVLGDQRAVLEGTGRCARSPRRRGLHPRRDRPPPRANRSTDAAP